MGFFHRNDKLTAVLRRRGGGYAPPMARTADTEAADIRALTMATASLGEADVTSWLAMLDAGERARAERFPHATGRVSFVAAHALARTALAAATGAPPAAFGFRVGPHGKPEALLKGNPAGVSFSLSHTAGMVGVAVARAVVPLGFDLEAAGRIVPENVARRCFAAAELDLLADLQASARSAALIRLWTLKEAFVKATGEGLARDLQSFRFRLAPPVIAFVAAETKPEQGWHFRQRLLPGGFVAATGWHGRGAVGWRRVRPEALAQVCRGVAW